MIAKSIAEYMKENGIKQCFLCEKTGMTKHSISYALSGKRKLSIEEYGKICAALHVSYDFFFRSDQHS